VSRHKPHGSPPPQPPPAPSPPPETGGSTATITLRFGQTVECDGVSVGPVRTERGTGFRVNGTLIVFLGTDWSNGRPILHVRVDKPGVSIRRQNTEA